MVQEILSNDHKHYIHNWEDTDSSEMDTYSKMEKDCLDGDCNGNSLENLLGKRKPSREEPLISPLSAAVSKWDMLVSVELFGDLLPLHGVALAGKPAKDHPLFPFHKPVAVLMRTGVPFDGPRRLVLPEVIIPDFFKLIFLQFISFLKFLIFF